MLQNKLFGVTILGGVKNIIYFAGLIIILFLVGRFFINTVQNEDKNQPQALVPPIQYEYYWSETCPHCANVSEFMQSWEGRDKITIENFEVNESRENQMKFYQRGAFCKISQNDLGVPLLVNPNGNCLLGDTPIIEYLKNLEL